MVKKIITKFPQLIGKPPNIIWQRIIRELLIQSDRFLASRHLKERDLLKNTRAKNLESLWHRLGQAPYPAFTDFVKAEAYESNCPDDRLRILNAAQEALAHRVDLLGSGLLELGETINWHQDYKTSLTWPLVFAFDLDYNNPDRPSDVKFPWELSRMQWLIPVGQAYLLTQDELYASKVRDILEDWLEANPYLYGVNWACPMEAALRILAWTWFYKVFWQSQAWAESRFRQRFLSSLYQHAVFIERYLERSVINGNHLVADAAGLLFAGLFFGEGRKPKIWSKLGWKLLTIELPRQVYNDGVDFEASIPYHRLVLELFLLPALYREACRMTISEDYRERLIAMARFTAAYCRDDGSVPLWGDADDARTLPFGNQSINDHRYLIGLVGVAYRVPDLMNAFCGSRSEIFWLLGPTKVNLLPERRFSSSILKSQAFPVGGYYIMHNQRDHVFIDCGPVGLAGRGGHGHNDCLSFEAVLDGIHLISDCGAYVYTASYMERNLFRSTAYHNTPQVKGEEINLIKPEYLWVLRYDAKPELIKWETDLDVEIFIGSHSGYQRLDRPLIPERTIRLERQKHILVVEDYFKGEGIYELSIPLYLAAGIEVQVVEPGILRLLSQNRHFILEWSQIDDWSLSIETARISPSYGRIVPSVKLLWQRNGLLKPLVIKIEPVEELLNDR